MERQNKSKSAGSKASADAAALAQAAALAEAAQAVQTAQAAQTAAVQTVVQAAPQTAVQTAAVTQNGKAVQNSAGQNGGNSVTQNGGNGVTQNGGNGVTQNGGNGVTQNGGSQSGAAPQSACAVGCGTLPGVCAPLAFPYIPMQDGGPVRYSRMEALETGTLFPGLNLPFKAAIQAHTKLNNTALVELMALDFALQELGLYLNTHPNDQEVLQLFWSYAQLAKEGRERYQETYGPLVQTDLTPEQGYAWLKDPWPWDVGGNR